MGCLPKAGSVAGIAVLLCLKYDRRKNPKQTLTFVCPNPAEIHLAPKNRGSDSFTSRTPYTLAGKQPFRISLGNKDYG